MYEVARVSINGQDIGMCISAPYRFEMTDCIHSGENSITVDIWGTYRDADSQRSMFEPLGLLGPVKIVII